MLPVITISRQFGSGGHEVGEKLAKRLELPFYDKELIALAAKKAGFPRRCSPMWMRRPPAASCTPW